MKRAFANEWLFRINETEERMLTGESTEKSSTTVVQNEQKSGNSDGAFVLNR